MFSLFKKNKDKTEVPKWASFFNSYQYDKFIKAVVSYFYDKNITYNLGDGMIKVEPNDFGLDVLGLTNVAQLCKLEGEENYEKIVRMHFEGFIRTKKFNDVFDKSLDNYDEVREYLAVRFYPEEYPSAIGKELTVGSDLIGGIYAMLVFDLPDSIVSIKPENADKWGKSFEELFEAGVQNVRNKYPFEISSEQLSNFSVWFVQGDHFFAPNIILDLDKKPELTGSYGSLICVPHRHAVIIYPIENMEVVNVITSLISIANGMYNEGPGSISNHLLWYYAGQFEDVIYEIEEDKIQLYPSEKFTEMLNNL